MAQNPLVHAAPGSSLSASRACVGSAALTAAGMLSSHWLSSRGSSPAIDALVI